MRKKRYLLIFTMGSLPLIALLGASDTSLINTLAGYHSAPAKFCTERDGDTVKRCNPRPNDCLFIRRVDARHAYVHAYSLQTDGHECEAAGVAEVVGDHLLLKDQGEIRKGERVEIYIGKGKIRFRYPEDQKDEMIAPFCGAQASLDEIELPVSRSAPELADMCGRNNE